MTLEPFWSACFEIPAALRPKPRHRLGVVGGHARAFPDKRGVEDERNIMALAAAHAPQQPTAGPVLVEMAFHLPISKSRSKWEQEAARFGVLRPTGKPDLDNMEKLILDALGRSGRWWRDDAQVVSIDSEKLYSDVPRTLVRVSFLPVLTRGASVAALEAQHGRIGHESSKPRL